MGADGSGRESEKYGDVMAWVSEEEICAAREMTAIEYLRRYQPNRLQKASARNEWQLTDHDSFKINEITSKWHWKSRDIGGQSALNFLIHVDGMAFVDAVHLLCHESPSYIPRVQPERKRNPFVLPERYKNYFRICRYLTGRGISKTVIEHCIRLGILYESAPYHNAVFVGKDDLGKARYAFLRGIYDTQGKIFRIEQAGSEKSFSFCIPPEGETNRVAVYEAGIDTMAHMTLEGGSKGKYRLALGGISAPKEGEMRREMKRPAALEHFLKMHPEIQEIEICLDNDFAGRWACSHIREAYGGKYQITENLPAEDGMDYGDMAKQAMERNRQVENRYATIR